MCVYIGFSSSSPGKESACNVGDLDLIAGLEGRVPAPVFWPGAFQGVVKSDHD